MRRGKERPPITDLPPACRAYGPEGGAVLRTLRSTSFEGKGQGTEVGTSVAYALRSYGEPGRSEG